MCYVCIIINISGKIRMRCAGQKATAAAATKPKADAAAAAAADALADADAENRSWPDKTHTQYQ